MAKSPNERSREALESNMLKDDSSGWTSIAAESCDVTAGVAMVGCVGRYYMEDLGAPRGAAVRRLCVRVCRVELFVGLNFVPGGVRFAGRGRCSVV